MQNCVKKFAFIILAFLVVHALTPSPVLATGVVSQNPTPLTSTQLRAVVITKQVLLQNFGFSRTVAQILRTGGVPSAVTDQQALLQTFINTFKLTSRTNNGIVVPVTSRLNNEATLLPANLLSPTHADGLRPVAITNRLDLAPSDGTHCGEQRIIYEKGGTQVPFDNRLTVIFEAVIPNPTPANGIAGCLPIANFWKGIETQALTDAALRQRLEDYFYSGRLPSGQVVQPPIHFLSYGNPFGQVRTNAFVNKPNFQVDWMLRQFRIAKSTTSGKVVFVAGFVSESPWRAFYSPVTTNDPAALQTRKTLCQNSLISSDLAEIFSPDLAQFGISGGNLTSHQLISEMGLKLLSRCKGGENNSNSPAQPTSPLTIGFENNAPLDTAVLNAMAAQLAAVPYRNQLTTDMALNRFNTQSCAGCHQLSNNLSIAPKEPSGTITWPPSLGFVHIDETGALSPLLTTQLLPARYKKMNDFITANAGQTATYQPATVQNDLNVKTLQDQIIASTLSDVDQETLTEAWRDDDASKQGAFFKLRPAD